MTDQPIVPSRIIPPGAALPRARAFDAPADAADLPPWRTPTPPPPPPPPTTPAEPAEMVVRHTVELVWAEPEPEPSRWNWTWLRGWARPWQSLIALGLAVAPIPPTGYSIGTAWAATLTEARTEAGLTAAYVLALLPLGLIAVADARTGRWYWRTALATGVVGAVGMANPFDLVTLLTGVHLS